MPDFDNLEIDFSNNNIVQNIVKHDFFSRITKVNLANNSLVDDMTNNHKNIAIHIRREEERNSHSTNCCAEY
jgi:hypothetical protein